VYDGSWYHAPFVACFLTIDGILLFTRMTHPCCGVTQLDRIVAVVEAEIERVERQRALLEPFASLDAWSAYHRARHHLYCYTAADCERAEHYLDLAARLDPHASRVLAGLSFVHWQRAFLEMGCDRSGATRKAFDCARHSVALDPLDPQGHWPLAARSC